MRRWARTPSPLDHVLEQEQQALVWRALEEIPEALQLHPLVEPQLAQR
jgi:hypothetical protein